MNKTNLGIIILLTIGIVWVSIYFQGPSSDAMLKYKKEMSDLHELVLDNASGFDHYMDDNEKKLFVRYLGFPDSIRNGENVVLKTARNKADYKTMVYIGSGDSLTKLGIVDRQVLEAYFPGREQQ